MIIEKINTGLSSFEIYCLFHEAKAIFLDSGRDHANMGRYSIIAVNPFEIVKSKNGKMNFSSESGDKSLDGNPFGMLREKMKAYHQTYSTDLPFIGGAVGYFGYDLCHHIEIYPQTANDDIGMPDLYLGFYHGAVVFDHLNNVVYITDAEVDQDGKSRVQAIRNRIEQGLKPEHEVMCAHHKKRVQMKPNMDKETYLKSIDRIKAYIESGDIYQANMTQRFETELRETPIALYKKLREINPAPFASFIDYGEGQIVSSSPERFIKVRDGNIETRPIKGTVPRGKTPEEDERLKTWLKNSEKDRSELLMIVDLERNDLSKVARTGTVEVPELFVIESYATVHHLVSTVTAELDTTKSVVDLLEASFPGGSITGAPKIRAMEVIDELEPTTRGVYTGSIGFIDFNGNADLNIVIRTIICKEDKAYFQVGGGIVWDSDAYMEYDETLHKARALMEALHCSADAY